MLLIEHYLLEIDKLLIKEQPFCMKTCTTCFMIKPTTEFNRRMRSKDGLNSSCRMCVNARVVLKEEVANGAST